MSRPAPPEVERTLCIVKPSAYAKRASIESTLVAHEFSVVAKQERTLTRAQATRLYLAHFGMPHFEGLIASMISGPVCVLLLARIGAVAELRHLVGPTDPVMARQVDATCLRAVYGGSTLLENGIHASKSLSEAAREEDVCFLRNKRTLILFGPPASGKGTQAELLIQSYGLVHISTGDLLRAHVKDGTPLGRTIKQFLEAGQLVPDELVTELTLERLAQPDCESQGWILDGFPRTPVQAQSLIDAGLNVNKFIVIRADHDALVERVSGRRFDPKTGGTYHVQFNPPPSGLVAERCVIRADDKPEVMRRRLATYDATIAGVVRQFHDVVAVQSDAKSGIWHVFSQMCRALEHEGTRKNVAIRRKSSWMKKRLASNL